MNIVPLAQVDTAQLVTQLRNGATIVYPTETCYGLGCDATNQTAVDRVFAIKQRQKNNPVLVIMADIAMAMKYVDWDPTLEHLAGRYWPGPLTVVANVRDGAPLASGVVAADQTLAFRITEDSIAQSLSADLGVPLVSTSANIAAMESPYDIASVCTMFENNVDQPDTIIDAGPLPHHAPSTIVRVEHGRATVLRQGELIIDTAL